MRVRFAGRTLVGVVVERAERAGHPGRLRAIEAVIDEAPVLSRELLDVLREAARDVLCPVGLALAAALPSGSAPFVARGFALTPRGRAAAQSGAVRGAAARVLAALAAGPLARAVLARRLGATRARALESLRARRPVAPCEVEQGPRARVAQRARGEPRSRRRSRRGARRARARAAPARRCSSSSRAGERLAPALPAAALRALAARGFARVHRRGAPRDVLGAPLEGARRVELTPDQARALAPIAAAVRRREPSTFLLHGVTGSGKTEVYLRAVAAALDAGRRALVLVPEITLTHQILARLRGRFGDALAVLHSGLRPGERLEQWQRLRAARRRSRSARARRCSRRSRTSA